MESKLVDMETTSEENSQSERLSTKATFREVGWLEKPNAVN